MEVDAQMCGSVNLTRADEEDRNEILNICKMSNMDLSSFSNFLEAAIHNHEDMPFKEQIKAAKTELNKANLAKSANERSIKQKVKASNYGFEVITDKLVKFRGAGGNTQSDKDFKDRTDTDVIIKSWNADNVDEINDQNKSHALLDFQNLQPTDTYDHWNLSAEKRVEALNAHFEHFVAKLKTEMNITEFHELGVTKNDMVIIVGRLVNTDSDVAFGSNIELINLSEENDSGMTKVKLNFPEGQAMCFFEGQIVVLEGTSDYDTFNVISVKELPIIKPEKQNNFMGDGALSVFIFNGPYTFADSLSYAPLKHIVNMISEQQPHVVVLGGPFLDLTNELICEGELFYNQDDGTVNCFEDTEIYGALKTYLDKKVAGLNTKVIIIPSLNDMVSVFPFPQPPLSKRDTENVYFLPNPARFSINGVEFGIVNTDIVRQTLSKSHIVNASKHRLIHIFEEIIRQKSFFPLYPPKEDTPIDISQFKRYEMPHAPDVLVTMSELPMFTDSIQDKTVFLNPGQVAKGTKRGSYAVVTINNDSSDTNLKNKVRVDIKNL